MSKYNDLWKYDRCLTLINLDKVDLLSIDIFDTLVLRALSQPKDLFYELGEKAIARGYLRSGMTAFEFQHLRILAEEKARKIKQKKIGTKEVNIADIYNAMPHKGMKITKLIDLELECEKYFCYINPVIISLIDEAHNLNINIVLTSDMYLSEQQIREILLHNLFPVDKLSNIYVSSEYLNSKVDGDLFKRIIEDFPFVPLERILHIGDNSRADIEGAAKLGIRSLYYNVIPQHRNPLFDQEKIFCVSALPELASLRKVLTNLSISEEENCVFFDTGVAVFGPIIALFTDWILSTAVAEKKDIIKCFTREGIIFSDLINTAAKKKNINVKAEILYISRMSVFLPSFGGDILNGLDKLFEVKGLKVSDLFNLFGLCEEDNYFPDYDQIRDLYLSDLYLEGCSGSANPRQRIIEWLLSNKDSIDNQLFKKREMFTGYLKQEFGNKARGALTVDIGYKGTIQSALEIINKDEGLDQDYTHLILLGVEKNKNLLLDGLDIRGYLGNAGERYEGISVILRSDEILEQLLITGELGTTNGYAADDFFMKPLTDEMAIDNKEISKRQSCHEGIKFFHEAWLDLISKKPFLLKRLHDKKDDLLKVFERLVVFPTYEEARAIGGLHQDDNFGSKQLEKICPDKDFKLLESIDTERFLAYSRFGYNHSRVRWPQGVITANDPVYLYKKYLESSQNGNREALMARMALNMLKQNVSEVVIFGAGEVGETVLRILCLYDIRVSFFVDRKRSLWGSFIDGIEIMPLENVLKKGCKVFAIGSLSFNNEIRKILKEECEKYNIQPQIFSPDDNEHLVYIPLETNNDSAHCQH